MLDLATLQAVADGTVGVRAAINRASKPVKQPRKPTARSGRKTGRATGRPATGRTDKLLKLLRERASLLVLAELTPAQTARLTELDLILTTPQRRARVQSDPDEREVRLPDGRTGVRVKSVSLPRPVSQVYRARLACAHVAPREDSPLGPTTPLYVDDTPPDMDQRRYQSASAPDTIPCYVPAKPRATLPVAIGGEYGAPHTPIAVNSPLLDRAPSHPVCRPTLPDQLAHSAPEVVAMVKAGDMSPESALALLESHGEVMPLPAKSPRRSKPLCRHPRRHSHARAKGEPRYAKPERLIFAPAPVHAGYKANRYAD